MMTSAGPKSPSSVTQKGVGGLGLTALIWTLWSSSSCWMSPLANVGSCVAKSFDFSELSLAFATGFLVVPVIELPAAVISVTLPSLTWVRNVLYEIVTCFGWELFEISELMMKFAPSSTTTKTR